MKEPNAGEERLTEGHAHSGQARPGRHAGRQWSFRVWGSKLWDWVLGVRGLGFEVPGCGFRAVGWMADLADPIEGAENDLVQVPPEEQLHLRAHAVLHHAEHHLQHSRGETQPVAQGARTHQPQLQHLQPLRRKSSQERVQRGALLTGKGALLWAAECRAEKPGESPMTWPLFCMCPLIPRQEPRGSPPGVLQLRNKLLETVAWLLLLSQGYRLHELEPHGTPLLPTHTSGPTPLSPEAGAPWRPSSGPTPLGPHLWAQRQEPRGCLTF